jgi:hypothetical protein
MRTCLKLRKHYRKVCWLGSSHIDHFISQTSSYMDVDIIWSLKRSMRCAGQVAHMGEMRNAYKILIGNPKARRPIGRPRHI